MGFHSWVCLCFYILWYYNVIIICVYDHVSKKKCYLQLGLLYWIGLIWITVWIINHKHYKLWDEITYPFPNFNSTTVQVCEWISFTKHVIIYPGMLGLLDYGITIISYCIWYTWNCAFLSIKYQDGRLIRDSLVFVGIHSRLRNLSQGRTNPKADLCEGWIRCYWKPSVRECQPDTWLCVHILTFILCLV